MPVTAAQLRAEAVGIWTSAVDAVKPERLVRAAVDRLPASIREAIDAASRILVIGGGKAGAGMAWHLERALQYRRDRIEGWVNVPAGGEALAQVEHDPNVRDSVLKTHLHVARPAGHNHPTADGVRGTEEMLRLVASAGPDDVAFCLLSGGGSALLPAPVEGITLKDKQSVTNALHACGATIHEMNAIRKHLSRVKGGRLAAAFKGRLLLSLIISDVVGDPLDVIASGPTAPDPTTFADSLTVIERYGLRAQIPKSAIDALTRGAAGETPETVKVLPATVHNLVIGSNTDALAAARVAANEQGYRVVDLGPFVEGETRHVAAALAGVVRNIRERGEPVPPPVCLLIGGETTVTLELGAGKGGRNQEFVLAFLEKLGQKGMPGVCVLSGGTDGEDGPTDAAGAVGTMDTFLEAERMGLQPGDFLRRHDAYSFFDATGGLIRTGLTGTNVMDIRVILVA